MNTIELKILKNPDNIDFISLESLLEKYPWFSILHIIYLLKIKKERPGELRKKLSEHIIYIHDRKRLFRILNEDIWDELVIQAPIEKSPDDEDSTVPEKNEKDLLEFSYTGEPPINPDDESFIEQLESEYQQKREKNPDFNNWLEKVDRRQKQSNDLIDRFLQSDPGPIPADKETRLEGDVSEKSVKEDESFITDTLAQIYIKQGLYSKAIFAYEKLSLKYPEKSVYFATQIEEIKNLKSNK
jgi:hypothetical protein